MVLENLTRRFGTTKALDGFTLHIEPGEFVALLGPSGCGKTTALRVLAGFERPDIGTVMVDGRDVVHVPAQKRDMGMVFQSYSLFPNMSARDNVAFGLQLRHQRGAQRRARADELLELVGLGEHLDEVPSPAVRGPTTARRVGAGVGDRTARPCSWTSLSRRSTPRCAPNCATRSGRCSGVS